MTSNIQPYTSEEAELDLEKIIAQETSGMKEAIPEQADKELAHLFVQMINSDSRHNRFFFGKVKEVMQHYEGL